MKRAHVVHHGVDHVLPLNIDGLTLPDRYVLFVGVRSGYKNFERLIAAMGLIRQQDPELALVCVGGGTITNDELGAWRSHGLAASKLHHFSGNEQQVAFIYSRAIALVFPSLAEGFGMPLTEAMIQDCPVICSQASCFPEICGDAAEYFDPLDATSIAASIWRCLTDPGYRSRLVLAGRERVSRFTWERCASETVEVYRRAVASQPNSFPEFPCE